MAKGSKKKSAEEADRRLKPERIAIAILQPTAALGCAAGMLLSARLWVSSHRLFPTTPIFRWIPQPPYPLDWILFVLAVASLLGAAISAWRSGPFVLSFLALGATLAAIDQSRLQPWLLIYAVLLGSALALPWEEPKRWDQNTMTAVLDPCRVMLVCTYFYSGVQKLGHGFVEALAGMLQPVFQRFHWNQAWLMPQKLWAVALLAALIEAGSGLMLAFPRTRRIAVVCLVLMHISLLLWLGPLALNWNRVIWPWNLAMMVLLMTLFWHNREWRPAAIVRSRIYTKAVAVLFGVLPVLSLLGLWDSYLGFALYSGNIKQGVVYVDPKRIPELPAGVRRYVMSDGVLDIDRWCATELGVPIYPETRVYMSAGRQVALWLHSGGLVRVIELGRPDLLTGQREPKSFDPLTY